MAMVDKKKKCMEKLLKPIAKRKGETKIVPDESAEMKACVPPFKETEIPTIYSKEQRTTKSQRRKECKAKIKQAKKLATSLINNPMYQEQANVAEIILGKDCSLAENKSGSKLQRSEEKRRI